MVSVITDYDGILFENEFAKAYGWYAACQWSNNKKRQDDEKISLEKTDDKTKMFTSDLILDIILGDETAKERLEGALNDETIKGNLEKAVSCAGGTTYEFAGRMYMHLVKGEELNPNLTESEIRSKGTDKEIDELIKIRGKIKDQIIDWFSEPIMENIDFFKRLYETSKEKNPDKRPSIYIVTQSKLESIRRQFNIKKITEKLGQISESTAKRYKEFIDFFYEEGHIECAGDGKTKEEYAGAKNAKNRAYQITCDRIREREGPDAEMITFEDTASGVKATRDIYPGVSIPCIGIKPCGSTQDLTGAGAVIEIEGTLENIANSIEGLADAKTACDALSILKGEPEPNNQYHEIPREEISFNPTYPEYIVPAERESLENAAKKFDNHFYAYSNWSTWNDTYPDELDDATAKRCIADMAISGGKESRFYVKIEHCTNHMNEAGSTEFELRPYRQGKNNVQARLMDEKTLRNEGMHLVRIDDLCYDVEIKYYEV